MPACDALPSIRELLAAFGDAVLATKDPRADVRRGSVYDHFGGTGAILFSREAQRDRDLFRALYFDTATATELTALGERRFGVPRVLDSFGTGAALLRRPSTAAGAGTIWAGTRILVPFLSGGAPARAYAVTADRAVGAADVGVSLPIRAADAGPGAAATVTTPGVARIDDPLWDTTWEIASLSCSAGTSLESPAAYRARVRAARLERRVGYVQALIDACAAQGAANVALFASGFAGDDTDFGLSACYVADASFATPDRLRRACTAALERYRVCGADLLVLPMTQRSVRFAADVVLSEDPGGVNLGALERELAAALLGSFEGRASGYAYSLDALRGAMLAASDIVQDVIIASPTDATTILQGTPPNFPPVLARYTLAATDVSLRILGPS